MYSNFENKVEILRKSPIYAMSLGSKELFRSNFWGWIMENDNYKNNFIKFLFPEIDIANIDAIEREQGYDALSELIVEFLNKAVTTVNLLPTPQS